ncbi:non-canonical purine NTP pyrophosphatase [Cardinium endosymbiont of Tipula unca]|uniref:non-canonical purine NTP pyrophosphatase n=1 Tax=Cardinium endosymbiont of Tipula unca TaxID=3066216 RepID=UPI0030D3F9EC
MDADHYFLSAECGFQPDGYDVSYGKMQPDEKNRISHRYKALMLLKPTFRSHKICINQ